MGKQARARKAREQRIQLPKEDFWELRARLRDSESIQLEAMKAAQEFGRQQLAAREKCQAVFDALVTKHGFDPAASYRLDDATCELIVTAPVDAAEKQTE